MKLIPLFVLAAVGVGGCGARPSTGATEQLRPTYDKVSGQLTRLDADANGDGKVDTWGYMDGLRVVRVEIDENGDGKVDRWEFHRRQAGEGADTRPDKTLERVERATRFDGRISRWEHFDNGALARVEEDTDGDGAIDKWETYNAGSLSMMTLDTAHSGKPDRRLIYRPDGSLDRIETDPTGSGTFRPVQGPQK
jgi:hypothetical protein